MAEKLKNKPLLRTGMSALLVGLVVAVTFGSGSAVLAKPSPKPEPILLIVMDPLSKELACACVKGYGQRDYRKLAARLEKALKQRVAIDFSDDLAESLSAVKPDREVIVIGDQTLVSASAKKAAREFHPVCRLTDRNGSTEMTGSVVARADDSIKDIKDLHGRKVLIGLSDSDARYSGAVTDLKSAGAALENRTSHSEAALDVLDSQGSPPPLAVIPTWSLPLLEGCGSVKPGSLKVLTTTAPAPFITVFLAQTIAAENEQKILQSLLGLRSDAKLLKVMESRDGFTPISAGTGAPKASSSLDWPDWRGPNRDGHVPKLPARLPAKPKFVWKKAAMTGGLAGLTVSGGRLILAERDFADEQDVYRCLSAEDGELVWVAAFPARGKLDYGQFPRATPVIHSGKVYLLGAFGGLRCVELASGKAIWQRQLPHDFKAPLPTWGMCSPPLIVDDVLIVNPGAPTASLAALDCATGRTRWVTPGLPSAYSAFIYGEFGGRRQIVGYDRKSLGGWDAKTGKRLWQLLPRTEGDFNVTTPVAVDGGILVSTENNGTRLYAFDDSGRIISTARAEFAVLAPTTSSPVVTCGRVFGACQGLHDLDVQQHLKPLWHNQDVASGDHASLIADDQRVLVMTLGGELILLDARANNCAIASRMRIFDEDVEIYSHPALAGTRLYARGGSSVVCVDLGED